MDRNGPQRTAAQRAYYTNTSGYYVWPATGLACYNRLKQRRDGGRGRNGRKRRSMADTSAGGENGKKSSRFNVNPRRLFSFSMLAGIPSNLALARKFMNSVNWKIAQEEIADEIRRK